MMEKNHSMEKDHSMEERRSFQKKKTDNKKYSTLSNVLYFHRHLYREYPKVIVGHGITVAGQIFLPFFGILMPGIVLRAVEGGELFRGLGIVGLAGLVMLLCSGIVSGVSHSCAFWEHSFREIQISEVVLKEMKCLYKYVEYGEEKKMIKRAYQSLEGWVSGRILGASHELLVNAACFFLYSTVLGTLEPWLVVFLLALSLAGYGIHRMKNEWYLASREQFAQSDREIRYLDQAFRNVDIAKDMRIFSMSDWMMDFREKVFGERVRMDRRLNRKEFLANILQFLLNVIQNGVAYVYLIHSCMQGKITAAGFLVYFGAITGFSGFVTGIVNLYSDLKRADVDASCFRFLMELPEIPEEGEAQQELFRRPAEIEFRDVSFSYGERKVYEHFNLTIKPGEKIALLGVNGAGKTTLVKLLCGLYEPDAGQILVNGVDIAKCPKRAVYDLFSVVFQEAALFPYTMGSNLSMKTPEETDEGRVWEVLREAGLEEVFREKGIRTDSEMTRVAFEDGVELSGGQMQRFFLARALYKDGNILILDEPASALDPIAESEIYQEYEKFSGGRTAIFISHRLATTRFSDRILLLENGRVAEEGTHEELMALDGSYANMFRVQSHYYRKQESEDAPFPGSEGIASGRTYHGKKGETGENEE